MNYILVVIYVFLTSTALTLMKLGGASTKLNVSKSIFNMQFSWIWAIGVVCYVLSFITWMVIISKFDKLSYIFPLVSGLIYIVVFAMAILVLKEKLTSLQIFGSILIVLGVVLININK